MHTLAGVQDGREEVTSQLAMMREDQLTIKRALSQLLQLHGVRREECSSETQLREKLESISLQGQQLSLVVGSSSISNTSSIRSSSSRNDMSGVTSVETSETDSPSSATDDSYSVLNDLDLDALSWTRDDEDSLLGEGSFGEVYRGVYQGEARAVKVLNFKGKPSAEDKRKARREARVAALVQHKHVIQYFGCCLRKKVLVFELAACSLHDVIHEVDCGEALTNLLFDGEKFSLPTVLRVWAEVVDRDLKPANVLLVPTDPGLGGFVADFGLATCDTFSTATASSTAGGHQAKGTYAYMAPELLRLEGTAVPYSWASDLYAVGVSINETLTRRTPFEGLRSFHIPDKERPVLFKSTKDMEMMLMSLVGHKDQGLLHHESGSRPTAAQTQDCLLRIQESLSPHSTPPEDSVPTFDLLDQIASESCHLLTYHSGSLSRDITHSRGELQSGAGSEVLTWDCCGLTAAVDGTHFDSVAAGCTEGQLTEEGLSVAKQLASQKNNFSYLAMLSRHYLTASPVARQALLALDVLGRAGKSRVCILDRHRLAALVHCGVLTTVKALFCLPDPDPSRSLASEAVGQKLTERTQLLRVLFPFASCGEFRSLAFDSAVVSALVTHNLLGASAVAASEEEEEEERVVLVLDTLLLLVTSPSHCELLVSPVIRRPFSEQMLRLLRGTTDRHRLAAGLILTQMQRVGGPSVTEALCDVTEVLETLREGRVYGASGGVRGDIWQGHPGVVWAFDRPISVPLHSKAET